MVKTLSSISSNSLFGGKIVTDFCIQYLTVLFIVSMKTLVDSIRSQKYIMLSVELSQFNYLWMWGINTEVMALCFKYSGRENN